MMEPAIRTEALTHRYRSRNVLHDVCLEVPQGSLYALLGPNGAGKTTLMKILTGLLKPTSGDAWLLGRPVRGLRSADRASVGYVAEGQELPKWMTLGQLTNYLGPLYPTWDYAFADALGQRLRLPSDQQIRTLSRGERMKVALLVALAPRPKILILDEPFTGMDALVKDEIVEGVLEVASSGAWSVFVCSHDIGQLESLADWVGFLDHGDLVLSERMDVLRDRFRTVDVMLEPGSMPALEGMPPEWLGLTRSGNRTSFLIGGHGAPAWEDDINGRFPGARRVDVKPATLREVFVGLTREGLGRASIRSQSRKRARA